MNFSDFFHAATQNQPYGYQIRLAESPCESRLINIPTGLGKTAAVVLAWLWNRLNPGGRGAVRAVTSPWPRRLVYCLPMRTLVEQTRDETIKWIDNLLKASDSNQLNLSPEAIGELRWLKEYSPIVLMGGEENDPKRRGWDIHPERPAILIGTQDMLLSRALNRGYGMARARWPMHFGLLNNDALWVLDETQLMGVGVRTSAQMEGLRQKLGTAVGCITWWASATLDSRLLLTPDYQTLPVSLALEQDDLIAPQVSQRVKAIKRLASTTFALAGDSGKFTDPYISHLAEAVLSRHQSGSTTIVILNRVDRAKDLHVALGKLGKKENLPPRILVHSRFRPMERDPLSTRIKEPGEKIIIATQAIEAGVDISARTLITELAPWSSLVQRFGRCNRKGEFNDVGGADIFWINLEAEDPKNAEALALPYTPEQLAAARSLLKQAESTGVSPSALEKFQIEEPLPEMHILRRKDLVDLFDTTPDLAGLDIDVGRYIRDGEERDVQVFWREIPEDAKLPDETITPLRNELLRVPLHGFRKFHEKNKAGIWFWNVLDGEWQALRRDDISPGRVYLINCDLGGYSTTLGWTGEKAKEGLPVLNLEDQALASTPRDGQDTDDESFQAWQSIEEHTGKVVAATQTLTSSLPESAPWSEALHTAARWHDVGKAHSCFQSFIIQDRQVPEEFKISFIAKAPWKKGAKQTRPHFRHELASALAWLQAGIMEDAVTKNLVAYLIATHHGKIRLSIRAMPGEQAPASALGEETPLFARGIWQGEKLPEDTTKHLQIEGFPAEGVMLNLSCMQMGDQLGGPSWTSRMLSLRDSEALGLFRLAWLESVMRSADATGSKQ